MPAKILPKIGDVDLPKFQIDPRLNHLAGYMDLAAREKGHKLPFDPYLVALRTLIALKKRYGQSLACFEIIHVRFQWGTGFHPWIEITGNLQSYTGISKPVKACEPFEGRSEIKAAIAKTVTDFGIFTRQSLASRRAVLDNTSIALNSIDSAFR